MRSASSPRPAATGTGNEPGQNSHVHGTKGAFVGGDWIDIEDCPKYFNIPNGSGATKCGRCRRSCTSSSAQKADGTYDVVIIGAGCIGSCIARELSKTTASVLVLEQADDVSQGATKGNSGIIHAGYDDAVGSVKARHCWRGNQMFPQLDRELHFGFERNGSLVVARNAAEEDVLRELLRRGAANGVQNLRILSRDEVLTKEPNLSPDVTAALYSPDAGSIIPYEFTIALAESAADNGVEFRCRSRVEGVAPSDVGFDVTVDHWEPPSYLRSGSNWNKKAIATVASAPFAMVAAMFFMPATLSVSAAVGAAIAITLVGVGGALRDGQETFSAAAQRTSGRNPAHWISAMLAGGSGSKECFSGQRTARQVIRTRFVVNAAGCSSDKIANMIGDTSFVIHPRLGEYILLDKDQGGIVHSTIFPTPDPVKGKGVLIQKTLWGNLILGPTARDLGQRKTRDDTTDEINTFILTKCRELVPGFDASKVIHSFCGARAKSSRGDWIIEPSAADPRGRFIHAAGIDSPGLAGSPSIALEVVQLLAEAGLPMPLNPHFNPLRAPIIRPKDGLRGLKFSQTLDRVPLDVDPTKNVVCKCERVTEAEIVEAITRSLPVDNTQAVRRRTRAGMGHCQADPDNYDCERRVAAIIARELKQGATVPGRRPWPATSTLPSRWPTQEQKHAFASLGQRSSSASRL